jgi:ribokinase
LKRAFLERSDIMITVIGSLNMNLVANVPRLPQTGETIREKEFQQLPGGKGANQADAIAKLGAPVKLLGCVGRDDAGKKLLASLYRDNVDISRVAIFENIPTGVATINVDPAGNNAIVVASGANSRFFPEQIQNLKEIMNTSELILTQLEIPLETAHYALKVAKELGKTTILNPAPALKLNAAFLAWVDILIPNETELERLSGMAVHTETEIVAAARLMICKGIKDVIVTLGEQGCIHVSSGQFRVFPAYQVNVVDTAAAGDSFIGALAVALIEGKNIEKAIPFAMAAAALTVTRKGAQDSLPGRREVEEFLRRQKA